MRPPVVCTIVVASACGGEAASQSVVINCKKCARARLFASIDNASLFAPFTSNKTRVAIVRIVAHFDLFIVAPFASHVALKYSCRRRRRRQAFSSRRRLFVALPLPLLLQKWRHKRKINALHVTNNKKARTRISVADCPQRRSSRHLQKQHNKKKL